MPVDSTVTSGESTNHQALANQYPLEFSLSITNVQQNSDQTDDWRVSLDYDVFDKAVVGFFVRCYWHSSGCLFWAMMLSLYVIIGIYLCHLGW